MTILLEELTRDAATAAYRAGATVILPTGSIEQHGPHLPVFTDTLLVTHIARQAATRATHTLTSRGSDDPSRHPADGRTQWTTPPILVAPTLHAGVSHHHLPFAGTMSLPALTYIDTLSDLLSCLATHEVARVLILNGHGGNEHPNGTVVQRLVHDQGVPIVLAQASYWTIGRDAMAKIGTYERFAHVPGHAGDFETSLVLALRPDLVHLGARREPLAPLQGLVHSARPRAFALAGGTTDNGMHADGAFGQEILDAVIAAVADYLVEFQTVERVAS